MNKLKKLLLISSALLISTANNTFAVTGTITASGTVIGTCSVAAATMAFGTLLQASGGTTITSSITPTCTNGTVWTITNSGNTNSLYLGGEVGTSGGTPGTILFPIIITSNSEPFTASNASAGKLTATGNGAPQPQTNAFTSTAADATGKTAGVYGGTVTVTISY